MNLTNQSHPFRFLQSVKNSRWIRWKASQRFSIVRPVTRAESRRRCGFAKTLAPRGFPNLFSERGRCCPSGDPRGLVAKKYRRAERASHIPINVVRRRTMKNLFGGPAQKAQILLASALLQCVWLFPSDALAQRTLQGRVVNGTTNRPVAQQKVELLTLGEGMNKNADAVSAADGSFRFTITESASSPHWLLRAIHQGVNYNLSVTPDQDLSQPVTVTIYETTQSSAGIEVSLPLMLAQASGNLLYVQQQYLLDNTFNTQEDTGQS